MDEELREAVVKILEKFDEGKYAASFRDAVDVIIAKFVKAQREAFVACDRWRGSFDPTEEQVAAEASRRYPDA